MTMVHNTLNGYGNFSENKSLSKPSYVGHRVIKLTGDWELFSVESGVNWLNGTTGWATKRVRFPVIVQLRNDSLLWASCSHPRVVSLSPEHMIIRYRSAGSSRKFHSIQNRSFCKSSFLASYRLSENSPNSTKKC